MTSFRIIPIPTEVAERVRRTLRDDRGATVVTRIAESNLPCRHCLEDAVPGERMLLFSYCPFTTAGPYCEVGPIYIHERACTQYAAVAVIPEQLRRRLLALRGYDEGGNMVAAQVVEGRAMDELLDELLARADVAFVQARNARPGCFACAIVAD